MYYIINILSEWILIKFHHRKRAIIIRKLIFPYTLSLLYSPLFFIHPIIIHSSIEILPKNSLLIHRSLDVAQESLTIADRYRLMRANRKVRYPFRCSFPLPPPRSIPKSRRTALTVTSHYTMAEYQSEANPSRVS